MTDNPGTAKPGRRLMIALFASLAVNLFFAGLLIGGPAFRDGGREFGHRGAPAPGLLPNPRVFVEALGPLEGRRLQREIRQQVPDLRDRVMTMRAKQGNVLAAMRADPYDPEALTAALAEIRDQHGELASSLQAPLADILAGLTPDQRQKLADAFERMRPRYGPHGDRGLKGPDGPR